MLPQLLAQPCCAVKTATRNPIRAAAVSDEKSLSEEKGFMIAGGAYP